MGGVLLGLDQMYSVSKLKLTSKVAMHSTNSPQDTYPTETANPTYNNAPLTGVMVEYSPDTPVNSASDKNNNPAITSNLVVSNSPQILSLTPLKPITPPLISKSRNNSGDDEDDEDNDNGEDDEDEYEDYEDND